MHHKRGKPKNSRAGCLMCKPNKVNGAKNNSWCFNRGFSKLRKEYVAKQELAAL